MDTYKCLNRNLKVLYKRFRKEENIVKICVQDIRKGESNGNLPCLSL